MPSTSFPRRARASALALGLALALAAPLAAASASVPPAGPHAADAAELAALMPRVVAWRRDLHQHPELGHAEHRTAGVVAAHLRALGFEVRTGIAGTGVSGLLRGGLPAGPGAGPRIALRADMDALPVTEETGLPFASTATTTYRGQPVGVMHACGHDAHVAIAMGVAERLAARRDAFAGEVMLVFQPAEEGPPEVGQVFGAKAMLDDGLFEAFRPDAVYGLHVWAALPAGEVGWRSGATMAAADEWTLRVDGRQAHGSRPWDGVDPITVAAQIQLAAQGILARQVDITRSPVVLTTGQVQGGVRFNIIPERVDMTGTLRTFDPAVREDVIARFERIARATAEASGASATLRVVNNAPLTYNDPALAERSGDVLRAALGAEATREMPLLTIAEDFSQYATAAPTFFFFVGATAPGIDPAAAPSNHSPRFMLDERALEVGVRALSALAFDALSAPGDGAPPGAALSP